MRKTRIAAVFALLLVLSSTPTFAIQRDRQLPGDEGPIDRIVRLIDRLLVQPVVHALDQIAVPHP